jgi:hypothetical protein
VTQCLFLQSLEELSRWLLAVSLRVVLRPQPEILTGLLEGTLSLPAELLAGAAWVGGQVQDVAGTARSNLVGLVLADGRGEGLDHLVHGAAATGSQVPCAHARLVGAQVVEGFQVAVGQVQDVDVVTDGGAITRVVV